MDKTHILLEIERTARTNGGKPLGAARFAQETGIREADWLGRHWARWGDALREAGYAANTMTEAMPTEALLEALVSLTRELGRYPARGDLKLKRRRDPAFPSWNVFTRLGSRQQIVAALATHCGKQADCHDVLPLIELAAVTRGDESGEPTRQSPILGFVYLLRAGKHYKIGKTNAHGRRERELAIQLPTPAQTIHVIRTDDPSGIENYWHARFAAKRLNGEWFALEAADVAAFKRRKFM